MHLPRDATTNLNSMSNRRLLQACVLFPRIHRTRNVMNTILSFGVCAVQQ
jgi:hypothetical protein